MASRQRRRAVGPAGARTPMTGPDPVVDAEQDPRDRQTLEQDDDRLRAERPPHHDRER